jgi:4-alpha-glucanotransferase
MTDPELRRRAEAAGIAPVYQNWREEDVEVSDDALAAILDALDASSAPDQPGGASGQRSPVDERASGSGETAASAAAGPAASAAAGTVPDTPRILERRSWGFTVQLYSVRSRQSWGQGDLADLADLATWSAGRHGAGFILVNPLHAAEPVTPVSSSPYLPMTRRYTSPLYLRIEDVPEHEQLTAAQRQYIEQLAAPLRGRNASPDLIDRDAIWTAKRAALEMIHAAALTGQRQADYAAFRAREGEALRDWSSWCALAEVHGADWRRWPDEVADPVRARQVLATGRLAERAEFHAWLQWLADEQMAAAQRAALAAGMDIGVIADLAVGVHPGGADAWAHQRLLVRDVSVGAPPDGFNQRGQNWSQTPWHPQRLATEEYRPLAELFRAALRQAGGIRVDHVMGLMRLWWVPEGMSPEHGAYVRYDHHATVAALAREAARAGAVVIGEDLGTVDPWIRRYLAGHGILGTTMLWFAYEPDGSPMRPSRWRRRCMATVGSHDLPTISGFRTGEQVTVRAQLGVLKQAEDAERKDAEQMLARWQDALVAEGLLPPGRRLDVEEFTVALYAYLARTPALLVGASLADAVGDRRAQNVPGTSDEYPNWRIPLCDASGRAVLLEDLPDMPLVQSVAAAASARQPVGQPD